MIHFKVDLRDSRDIHNFQAAQVAMVHYLPQKKSQPSLGGTGKKVKCILDLFHVQWNIFYINVVVTYIHNLLANRISQGAS